jgi:hypothetical protein
MTRGLHRDGALVFDVSHAQFATSITLSSRSILTDDEVLVVLDAPPNSLTTGA